MSGCSQRMPSARDRQQLMTRQLHAPPLTKAAHLVQSRRLQPCTLDYPVPASAADIAEHGHQQLHAAMAASYLSLQPNLAQSAHAGPCFEQAFRAARTSGLTALPSDAVGGKAGQAEQLPAEGAHDLLDKHTESADGRCASEQGI